MKNQIQTHSDSALDDHPDRSHAPEAGVHADKLGDNRGRGRTGLRPGGATDAEQMLDQDALQRRDRPADPGRG